MLRRRGKGPVGGLAGGGDAVVEPGASLLQLGQVPGQGPGTVVEPGERSDNFGDGKAILDQGLAVVPEASAVGAASS